MIEGRGKGREERTGWIETIRVLLFNVMGARMGVDVEQTAGMLDPRNASVEQLNVVAFHEKLFRRGDRPAYVAPMVLLVRGDEGKHGLLIDQPESIVSVGADAIRPLPALIEASMQSRAVWGVALIEGEMVLLVDLYELRASGMPES